MHCITKLIDDLNNKFGKIIDEIAKMGEKAEESHITLAEVLKEIMSKFAEELGRERGSSKEFEDRVYVILEETCLKLSTHFVDSSYN